MTCTLLAVARASVTECASRAGENGCSVGYADEPSVRESFGGPMECADLIRTFLFPIIHRDPVQCLSRGQTARLSTAMVMHKVEFSMFVARSIVDPQSGAIWKK